jgi:dihydrofolate reductase
MGRKTNDWVTKQFDFSHADKNASIITRTERQDLCKTFFYTGDLADLVKRLKGEQGENI